jgi:tRNA-dihydrouridine synthase B
MYSGRADWDIIRDTKQALTIPVIANGDIMSGADAVKALRYTGADAVMIGRGAFGNPWIFAEADALLNGSEAPPLPNTEELVAVMLRQFDLMREQKGEHIACLEARKHFAWYLRGIPYSGIYKQEISQAESCSDILKVTHGVLRDLDAGKRV